MKTGPAIQKLSKLKTALITVGALRARPAGPARRIEAAGVVAEMSGASVPVLSLALPGVTP
jgi:hypothetical protein